MFGTGIVALYGSSPYTGLPDDPLSPRAAATTLFGGGSWGLQITALTQRQDSGHLVPVVPRSCYPTIDELTEQGANGYMQMAT
jgi:hypothetical protein